MNHKKNKRNRLLICLLTPSEIWIIYPFNFSLSNKNTAAKDTLSYGIIDGGNHTTTIIEPGAMQEFADTFNLSRLSNNRERILLEDTAKGSQ